MSCFFFPCSSTSAAASPATASPAKPLAGIENNEGVSLLILTHPCVSDIANASSSGKVASGLTPPQPIAAAKPNYSTPTPVPAPRRVSAKTDPVCYCGLPLKMVCLFLKVAPSVKPHIPNPRSFKMERDKEKSDINRRFDELESLLKKHRDRELSEVDPRYNAIEVAVLPKHLSGEIFTLWFQGGVSGNRQSEGFECGGTSRVCG